MQVYDIREQKPDRPIHADRHAQQLLDDGAISPYGVACLHEQRAVVEVRLGERHLLLSCAECGTVLGVTQRPAT